MELYFALYFASLYSVFRLLPHISTRAPGRELVNVARGALPRPQAGGSLSAKSVLTLLQPCFYRPFCIVSLVWSFAPHSRYQPNRINPGMLLRLSNDPARINGER